MILRGPLEGELFRVFTHFGAYRGRNKVLLGACILRDVQFEGSTSWCARLIFELIDIKYPKCLRQFEKFGGMADPEHF